jgi:hypothetical protein
MTDTLTIVALVVTIVALALALVAIRARRPWLAAFSIVPVVAVIIVSVISPAVPTLGLGVALTIALLLVGVIAGSPIVALILRLASHQPIALGSNGGILVTTPPQTAQREVLRGGATIGYLERFALVGSVLAGQVAAVAIVVAIKGLGRFSELESAEARERFIIGTLASLVWAGLCAAAAVLAW